MRSLLDYYRDALQTGQSFEKNVDGYHFILDVDRDFTGVECNVDSFVSGVAFREGCLQRKTAVIMTFEKNIRIFVQFFCIEKVVVVQYSNGAVVAFEVRDIEDLSKLEVFDVVRYLDEIEQMPITSIFDFASRRF